MSPRGQTAKQESGLPIGCLEGDPAAWDDFVRRFSPLIRQVIGATLARFNAADRSQDRVADLFQGVFLALWEDDRRRLRSFQGRNNCSVNTWLRVVVSRLVIDALRRTNPYTVALAEEQPDDDDAPSGVVLADEAPLADDRVQARQALEFIQDELNEMDQRDRLVLKLRFLDGMSGKQVAEMIGISRNHVDQISHRVKNRLKDKAAQYGYV